EGEAARGRGVDGELIDGMQRALRERREGADALDLGAEELDAEGLAAGRRIDVDDAAAQRELPALLGLVDALVAGEREVFHDRVDARVVSGAEANRLGPRLGWGHGFGERGRGCAAEAAAGEHIEGAGPLADEVRRRLGDGAAAEAPAGEQPHSPV